MSVFGLSSVGGAPSRPRHRYDPGTGPRCVRSYHATHARILGSAALRNAAACSSPAPSPPPPAPKARRASAASGRRSVGGLAVVVRWTTKGSGTLASASSPRICSLGIHPCSLTRSSQLARAAEHSRESHWHTRSWWNPSSQRNPRGKKERLGTAVKSAEGNDRTGGGGGGGGEERPGGGSCTTWTSGDP